MTTIFTYSINCSNIVNQLQYALLQNQITSIKKKVISMELMDLTRSEPLSSEYSGSVKQLRNSILSSSCIIDFPPLYIFLHPCSLLTL